MPTQQKRNNDLGGISPTSLTLSAALKASFPSYLAIGAFSFFINLLMLTGPIFMLQIYDRVLSSRSIPTLIVLFALVAGLFAVLGVLDFIRSRILTRISSNVVMRIRRRVFDATIKLSLSSGGHTNAAMPLRELGTVQQFLAGPAVPALFDAPWVPVYLGVIFLFHWQLGVLATVSALLLFLIAWLNDVRSRKPSADASAAASKANQVADNGRRNAEVLASMAMLQSIRGRWEKDHMDATIHETTARDRMGTLGALSKSLRLFLQSAMLAVGAALVIFGQVTPGVMIAASIILGRALQPVEQAIAHWRGLINYRQAKKRLDDMLKKLPPHTEKMMLPPPTGQISVRGLRVVAPGGQKVLLDNINFDLAAGTAMGVVGMSASGKSTLSRVLVGAWPPAAGGIRLDGATFNQWDPNLLGKHIGYLPQDVELFGGTLKENISRFADNPNEEAIVKAAAQAGIHEMIKQLGGYDVDIGYLGTNLSVGQRQRVALARALYGEPVLIVLDEPNSSLDVPGEQALAQAIKGIKQRGQTLVIITHQMNVLSHVDTLLELTAGKQTQFGPRDQVIASIREQNKKGSGKRQISKSK